MASFWQFSGGSSSDHCVDGDTDKRLTSFPVLPKYQISRVEGSSRSNVSSFFSVVGHVEGDSALSLGVVENSVHGVQQRHVFVHFDDCVFVQLLVQGRREVIY